MSIAAAKLTCYGLVKSRNGSYPSLMAAAVKLTLWLPQLKEVEDDFALEEDIKG